MTPAAAPEQPPALPPFERCPECLHPGWAHPTDPPDPLDTPHCIGSDCRCYRINREGSRR